MTTATVNGQKFELDEDQIGIIDQLRADAADDMDDDIDDDLDDVIDEAFEAGYEAALRSDAKGKKPSSLDDEDMDDDDMDDEDMDERSDAADWQERAATAEARLAVLTSLMHGDADDGADDDDDFEYLSEDDLEDLIEQEVSERVDSLIETYNDARPYLPSDYQLTGQLDPHTIRCDALRHTSPRLDSPESTLDWDSVDSINAAYEAMKLYQRRDTRSPLEQVFDRRDGNCGSHEDMYGEKKVKVRKRKPDYSLS